MYSFSGHLFKEQYEGEKVIKVVHRHWFNMFLQFIIVIIACFAIFGSWFFILYLFPQVLEQIGTQTIAFIETTALLFVWFYSFLIWIDYYFDIWIITETRIINIEQRGLFIREASDLQYDKIQDVTAEVTGLLPTILNFGDIQIQTAGEKEQFKFRQVPDPYGLKSMIMEKSANATTDQATTSKQ